VEVDSEATGVQPRRWSGRTEPPLNAVAVMRLPRMRRLLAFAVLMFPALISCGSVGSKPGKVAGDPWSVQQTSTRRIHLASVPHVGEPLPSTSETVTWTVHKGRERCASSFEYSGIECSIDVDCASGRVVYIETRDPDFVTPDGIRVGASVDDLVGVGAVLEADSSSLVGPRSDDRAYVLPSGWSVVVGQLRLPGGASGEQVLLAFREEL